MSAVDLVQLLSNALFVLIFVLTLGTAIRYPRTANIEIALLFGAAAVAVAESWVFRTLGATPPAAVTALAVALILALPYILLRLVDEFAGVPSVVLRLAEAGLAASVVAYLAAASQRRCGRRCSRSCTSSSRSPNGVPAGIPFAALIQRRT